VLSACKLVVLFTRAVKKRLAECALCAAPIALDGS
jgi:hypothetical protein